MIVKWDVNTWHVNKNHVNEMQSNASLNLMFLNPLSSYAPWVPFHVSLQISNHPQCEATLSTLIHTFSMTGQFCVFLNSKSYHTTTTMKIQ